MASCTVIGRDIEKARKLKDGDVVQISPHSQLARVSGSECRPSIDYKVTGTPTFEPHAYLGWHKGEDVYGDNVTVPLTDGIRRFSLSFGHLL
jgi:hypothetical protein